MKKKLLFLGFVLLGGLSLSHGVAAVDDGGTKSMKISSQGKCYGKGSACLGPV